VLDGDPAPPWKGGTTASLTFRSMYIVAKRSPISETAELLFSIESGRFGNSIELLALESAASVN